jgi:hypothetical protein
MGLTGIFQKGKKSLKMPKRLSESVYRRIDNTMVKRKKNKQRSTKHFTEDQDRAI